MIGSHIEFGCQLNTSNFRTISTVNYYRCHGFECLPEIESCWCPEDQDRFEWEYAGDPSLFPWYDASDPASSEYLGKMMLRVDGFQSSTGVRTVADSLGGSYVESKRKQSRELVFDGLMFALSARGLEFGKRWEAHQLWDGFCDCCENIVKIRSVCSTELYELRKFTPTAGPTFTNFFGNGRACNDIASRFEFVAQVLDPSIYTKSVEVSRCVFGTDPVCETWECEPVEHVCSPECCGSCLAGDFSDLFDVSDDSCCYCRPLVVHREVVELPNYSMGTVGLDVKLFSGSQAFSNGRLLIVEAASEAVFAETDVWSKVRVVDGVEFAPVPAGVTVSIDGKCNQVKASCGGVATWVYDAGGLPFSGLSYPAACRNKVFAVFEADYYTVAEDAEFQISSFRKFN